MPKTGSTYLQNCLSKLSHEKLLINTEYPILNNFSDNKYEIGSGNGMQIANMLVEHLTPEFDLEKLCDLVLKLITIDCPRKNLVLSSENFSAADPYRFECLVGLLIQYCENVKLVVVVRNVCDYAYSSYNQLVKRRAFSLEYNEYCKNYFISELAALLKRVDKFNIPGHCIPYTNDSLLIDFLSVLDEEFNDDDFKFRVNRSLTETEIKLLVKINAIFSSEEICTKISDSWLNKDPYKLPSKVTSDDLYEFALLDELNVQSELAHLIKTIMFSRIQNNYDDFLNQKEQENNEDLFLSALKSIFEFMNQNADYYTSRLEKNKNIFDPIHYLLLNKDVMSEKVDPVEHYIKFGKKEGRYTSFDMLQISVPR